MANQNNELIDKLNVLTDSLELQKHAQEDADLSLEDFTLLMTEDELNEQTRVLREFAVGENLAHNLAYQNFSDGQIVMIKDADFINRPYQVMNLKTGHNSVMAQVFVPTQSDNANVHVAFRGTSDFATLHADLEKNAGEEAIYKRGNMDKIMSQINDVVGYVHHKTNQEVHLNFAGHSLGGALAAQALTAAMGRKNTNRLDKKETSADVQRQIIDANDELNEYFKTEYGIRLKDAPISERKHFDNVSKFSIHTWNKTGESLAVENYANKMAAMIPQKQGEKSVVARFGMVGGDAVQQTGEGSILANCPEADVAVLKVDVGLEGKAKKDLLTAVVGAGAFAALGGFALGPAAVMVGSSLFGMIYAGKAGKTAFDAHTAYHFDDTLSVDYSKIRYEFDRNTTAEAQKKVTTRLKKKSTGLQTSVMRGAKACLHKAGQFVSGLFGRRPKQEEVQPEVVKPVCR